MTQLLRQCADPGSGGMDPPALPCRQRPLGHLDGSILGALEMGLEEPFDALFLGPQPSEALPFIWLG